MCSSQLYVSQGKASLKYMYGVVSYVCAGILWKALGFVEFPELATI